MDNELLPYRIRRKIERFEKQRMMNKRKRVPKFCRLKRNGIKTPLKHEDLIEVRNEYGNI